MNSAGAVVGYSYLGDNGTQHAFIYTAAERMRDLNALLIAGTGWTLTEAKGINDRGQITGIGRLGMEMHAFLLTSIVSQVRITSVSRLEDGHILVRGVGTPFQTYAVETTNDLTIGFTSSATVTAESDGTVQFEDDVTGMPRLFYRFALP